MSDIHEFLKDNVILLLKDFLHEFDMFIPHVTLIDDYLAASLHEIYECIPVTWKNYTVECSYATQHCLITDRLFVGLMPAKSFTELLLTHPVNVSAIAHWEKDLDCTIEDFLWQTICKKSKLIFFPGLRDFHI